MTFRSLGTVSIQRASRSTSDLRHRADRENLSRDVGLAIVFPTPATPMMNLLVLADPQTTHTPAGTVEFTGTVTTVAPCLAGHLMTVVPGERENERGGAPDTQSYEHLSTYLEGTVRVTFTDSGGDACNTPSLRRSPHRSLWIPNPGSHDGALCLAGPIGRFLGPGQVQNAGATGSMRVDVGLMHVPA